MSVQHFKSLLFKYTHIQQEIGKAQASRIQPAMIRINHPRSSIHQEGR